MAPYLCGVWCSHGVDGIHWSTSLTGARYVSLPGVHFQTLMDFVYPHGAGILQQVKAVCHQVRVVRNILESSAEWWSLHVRPP